VTGADNDGNSTAVGTRGMPSISGSGRGPRGGCATAMAAASATVNVAAVRAGERNGMVFPLTEEDTLRHGRKNEKPGRGEEPPATCGRRRE
jgi:hypothetical protein